MQIETDIYLVASPSVMHREYWRVQLCSLFPLVFETVQRRIPMSLACRCRTFDAVRKFSSGIRL